jgi:hypothetical protein
MEHILKIDCKTPKSSRKPTPADADMEAISPTLNPGRCQTQPSSIRRVSLYLNDDLLPSPSAVRAAPSTCSSHSGFFDELTVLQQQIHDINAKITHNLRLLQEKETKNKELKNILNRIESKTQTTDVSFESVPTGSVKCGECQIY